MQVNAYYLHATPRFVVEKVLADGILFDPRRLHALCDCNYLLPERTYRNSYVRWTVCAKESLTSLVARNPCRSCLRTSIDMAAAELVVMRLVFISPRWHGARHMLNCFVSFKNTNSASLPTTIPSVSQVCIRCVHVWIGFCPNQGSCLRYETFAP
jgi:hypothetical protein